MFTNRNNALKESASKITDTNCGNRNIGRRLRIAQEYSHVRSIIAESNLWDKNARVIIDTFLI